MRAALALWLADALVVLGALVMTIGVAGVIRMPDVFTKIHASSKSVVFGVCSFLLAAFISGDDAIRARVALIGMLLVLTTPVAAHEIARAAVREKTLTLNEGGSVAGWQGGGEHDERPHQPTC